MNRLDLSVSVRRGEQPGVVIVVVGGEIDIYSADKLRDALVSRAVSDCPNVVLDMTDVDFTDSTGLGVMVGAHKRAHRLGGSVTLAGVGEHLHRVLTVTGLVKVFAVFETVELATAAAPRTQRPVHPTSTYT